MQTRSAVGLLLVGVFFVASSWGGWACHDSPPEPKARPSRAKQPPKTYSPVPKWAHFYSPKQYDAFKICLTVVQRKLSLDAMLKSSYEENTGVLNVDLGNKETFEMGLLDMAKELLGRVEVTWCEELSLYVQRQVQAAASTAKLKEQKADFSKIKDKILVRLYALTAMPADRRMIVYRETAPHVVETLVVVVPGDIMVGVAPEDLKNWKKTAEELFELAHANMKGMTAFSKDGAIQILSPRSPTERHHYVASYAIAWVKENQKNALVGFPTNKKALVQVLDGKPSLKQAEGFFGKVITAFGRAQGPVVAHVYFFHEGTFTAITERSGDRIRLAVPEGGWGE